MISNFIQIEDNKFLGSNGVFGVAYKLDLFQKYSLSEDDFEELHMMWTKAFSLIENAIIVKNDFYLPSNFDTSSFEELNFLQKSTKEYFKDRPYLEHNSYIFFLKADFDTYKNSSWYNPFKKVVEDDFLRIEEEHQMFYSDVQNVISFIEEKKFANGNRISLIPMNHKELIAYENMYFSGLDSGFTTNVFSQDKELYTGDKKIGVFSIDNEANLPNFLHSSIIDQDYTTNKNKFYRNYADNFSFNLNFAHIYSQVFFIDNARRSIAELQRVSDNLNKNRGWNTANEVAGKQVKEILESLENNEDRRIIRGNVSVTFFEEDNQKYKKHREQIRNSFNALDIVPHYLSAVNRKKSDYFLNFPIFAPYLNDKQLFKLPLDCACCLISNSTHYKKDEEGILFTSRVQDLPILLDNYFEDKKYENARNGIIIASTGWGKSTLINHLVRTYYERKEKVVIIDYGGSYSKLGEFFNQDVSYITYQDGKPLGFNIFDICLKNGEYQNLSSDDLERITHYILIHTQVPPKVEEIEVMKKIISKYYSDELDKPTFHKFYNYLDFNRNTILKTLDIEEEYFDIKRFLLLTNSFSNKGALGFVYDETEERIQDKADIKPITIFELEQASKNPTILSLLLYLSDVIIDKQILSDPSIRGHIIFDEVAKMYKYEGVLEKVELHYQTVRKKEAEITQVLQSVHQLPQNNVAKAIIENTQILYVLKGKDYTDIQKAFNLSDHALYEMESIQGKYSGTGKKYSEIWIMRGQHHAVYRLELPPEVFWNYQTDGKENALLMKEFEKTKDLETAIKNMVEKDKNKI